MMTMFARPWIAAAVAALFAVHPQHVESVAWVAERKDVLSGLCWMGTLLAYVWYARRPTVLRYATVAGGLACGLLAKAMVVTLPFVLLLLDHWPLRRTVQSQRPGIWRRLVLEKMPLLAMVATVAWITWASQQAGGAMRSEQSLPLLPRVANAVVAYATYLGRTVWPADLAIFYPHPYLLAGGWTAAFVAKAVTAAVFLAAITWLAVRQRTRRPYLLMGWLWYLGTLLPVIGIVQVGAQASADRYSYLPLVGVFLSACLATAELAAFRRWSPRYGWISIAVMAAVGVALTAHQAAYWRDDLTLFGHAVEAVPDNYLAHNHLGLGLHRRGRIVEAAAEFDRAIAIRPDFEWALNNRATCALAQRDYVLAQTLLQRALAISPAYDDAWNNLGNTWFGLRRYDEAARAYEHAVQSARNERVDYLFNLALACERLGRWPEALRGYSGVLQAVPGHLSALHRAGVVLAISGRIAEAKAGFERMAVSWPGAPEVFHGLGLVAALEHDPARAEELLRRAVASRPEFAEAHRELAALLLRRGDASGAVEHWERSLVIEPDDPDALNDLAVAEARRALAQQALQHLEHALKLQPDHACARQNLDAVRAGRQLDCLSHPR
jgi:tetratricopeptide (TPR) repeat protein